MSGQPITVTITLENGAPVIPASDKLIKITEKSQVIRWRIEQGLKDWKIAAIPFIVPAEWVSQFPSVEVPANRRSVAVVNKNTEAGIIPYDVFLVSPNGTTIPIDPELENEPPVERDVGYDDDDDDDDDDE